MKNYGVLANMPGMSPFIFIMTDSMSRAASLMHHYAIQRPEIIYGCSEIPEDARTGDYFVNGVLIPS
jgi:hypothetical protein